MNQKKKRLTAGDVTRILDRLTELVDGDWTAEDLETPELPFRRLTVDGAFVKGAHVASPLLQDSERVNTHDRTEVVVHAHQGNGRAATRCLARNEVVTQFEPAAKVGLKDATGMAVTLGFLAGVAIEDVLINGNEYSQDPLRRCMHGMRVLAPFTHDNEGEGMATTTFGHLLRAMRERGCTDNRRLRFYARMGTIRQYREYLRSRSTCCGDYCLQEDFVPTPFGVPLQACQSIVVERTPKDPLTELYCTRLGNVVWALARDAWVRPVFKDDDLRVDLRFGFHAAFLDETLMSRAKRVRWPEEGDEDHDGKGKRREAA